MPRIYPTTPRLVDGQFPNSHDLNKEVRACLDTANSLDSKNFASNTITKEKVAEHSFIQPIIFDSPKGSTDALDDTVFLISTASGAASTQPNLIRQATKNHVEEGLIRGWTNIQFLASPGEPESIEFTFPTDTEELRVDKYEQAILDDAADVTNHALFTDYASKHTAMDGQGFQLALDTPADTGSERGVGEGTQMPVARMVAPVQFFVLMNGERVGETEFITHGSVSSASIPLHYLHDGGPLKVEVYCLLPDLNYKGAITFPIAVFDTYTSAILRRR